MCSKYPLARLANVGPVEFLSFKVIRLFGRLLIYSQPWEKQGSDVATEILNDIEDYRLGRRTLKKISRERHVAALTLSRIMAAAGLKRKRGGYQMSRRGKEGMTCK
jgi:hypothetical protein